MIDNYKRNAQNYYIALSARGLNAQITCALPESRKLALTRLDAVRKELTNWYEEQLSFYDLVNNRIGEMDGTFVNSEKQDKFEMISTNGKTQAKQAYEQADKLFADTIQKVKTQIQAASQPLSLIVELDAQGKIKKVSRLVNI